jgi:hypothetical protein
LVDFSVFNCFFRCATRLILSHLGFLSLSALRGLVDSPVPRLVCLESSANSFPADLESLDRLSPRTFDTILAYYVRAGQANPQVIFNDIFVLFKAVLWIRILRFLSVTFKMPKKLIFSLLLLKVHLHHSSKIKSHQEVTKH